MQEKASYNTLMSRVTVLLIEERKMFGSFRRSRCRHLLTKSSVHFDPPFTEEDSRGEGKRNSGREREREREQNRTEDGHFNQ